MYLLAYTTRCGGLKFSDYKLHLEEFSNLEELKNFYEEEKLSIQIVDIYSAWKKVEVVWKEVEYKETVVRKRAEMDISKMCGD